MGFLPSFKYFKKGKPFSAVFMGLSIFTGHNSLDFYLIQGPCTPFIAMNSSGLLPVLHRENTHTQSTISLCPPCSWNPLSQSAGVQPGRDSTHGSGWVLCQVCRQAGAAGFGPGGPVLAAPCKVRQPHLCSLPSLPSHDIPGRRTKHLVKDESIFKDEETEVLLG